MVIEKFNERAKEFTKNWIIATLQKIDVAPGKCRYNFQCGNNAVHDALKKDQDRVAVVFYIDSGDTPILHFVNVDESGKFKDNTLGHWCVNWEYYLVKYIPRDDFFNIYREFDAIRKDVRNRLPFLIKLLSDYKS